ncbi:MAG: ATP-binding protein, partial [Chloroherpetonaceae bacterium]|nr:ATP-binding protein [Chloroherpetonaceae bacterium]
IEETEIEKIFTPFYRGKNHAQAEGSGIGLALTKRIVELHRGTIAVRSQLGKGTTFTLEFPNQIALIHSAQPTQPPSNKKFQ